jgi:hypothetical protein
MWAAMAAKSIVVAAYLPSVRMTDNESKNYYDHLQDEEYHRPSTCGAI